MEFHLGLMVYACNPSTQEIGAGRSGVQNHPRLRIQLDASLGYVIASKWFSRENARCADPAPASSPQICGEIRLTL